MIGGAKSLTRISIVLVTAVLMAACSASVESTVTQVEPTGVQTEPTRAQPDSTVVQTEPTRAQPEPTAVAATPTADEVDPTAVADPAPLPPARELPVSDFRSDSLLGLSHDGRYAYAGTTSPWNTASPCGGESMESLAVVAVDAGISGDWTPGAAGIEQAGDIRQLVFDATDQVAITSSCGETDFLTTTAWLHVASIASNGTLTDLVGPLALEAAENESNGSVTRWVDEDTVEISVLIAVDPDAADTWLLERRNLSLSSGATTVIGQIDYYSDEAFFGGHELTTDQGITYREIEDPSGRLGCEGFGVARTIEVDDGDEQRLALGEDGPAFASVADLHTSASGHVAWTTGCEGFTSAWVGKLQASGSIVDAHLVESPPVDEGSFSDFQYYRLRGDGELVAMGLSFNQSAEDEVAFAHFDLTRDPSFVNTAEPAPAIDQEPILVAIDGASGWHVGETLSSQPACGGTTLYGRTQSGFVRAFGQFTEIDAIVDADVAEIVRVSFPDSDYVGRTVVFSTECPGEYEGRRVWFGTENENLNWGLPLEQADMVEVKSVLSVRDQFGPDSDFPTTSFVQVELLDGTITEIELIAVPFR